MTERSEGAHRLPSRARLVLRALVPVLCPPEAEALGLEDAIVEHVEGTLASLPRAIEVAVIAGLHGVDLGARVTCGQSFASLGPGRARRYIASWLNGPLLLRESIRVVKALVSFSHYEMHEVQEDLGYRPHAWVARVAQRRLALYQDDIQRQDESILAPDPLPLTRDHTTMPGREEHP